MTELGRPLSRRTFLTGIGIVALAVTPSGLARLLSSRGAPASTAAERFVALFSDPAEVVPLGRAYLRKRRDRPGPERLLTELLPPTMTDEMVLASSDDELRVAIDTSATSDLVAGRIEEVDGWLLSQTEVKLAALVAIFS